MADPFTGTATVVVTDGVATITKVSGDGFALLTKGGFIQISGGSGFIFSNSGTVIVTYPGWGGMSSGPAVAWAGMPSSSVQAMANATLQIVQNLNALNTLPSGRLLSAAARDTLISIDALLNLYVLGVAITTPPGSPSERDAYIVGASATGAWEGQDGNVAYHINGEWTFHTPFRGLRAYNEADKSVFIYLGGQWVPDPISSAILGRTAALGPVDAVQTSALPAFTYDHTGKTITGNANGAIASSCFDGVAMTVGHSYLLGATPTTGVSPSAWAGPYALSQLGDSSHPFIFTLRSDANADALMGGLRLAVSGGATWGGHVFSVSETAATITAGGGLGTAILHIADFGTNDAAAAVAAEVSRATTAEAAEVTARLALASTTGFVSRADFPFHKAATGVTAALAGAVVSAQFVTTVPELRLVIGSLRRNLGGYWLIEVFDKNAADAMNTSVGNNALVASIYMTGYTEPTLVDGRRLAIISLVPNGSGAAKVIIAGTLVVDWEQIPTGTDVGNVSYAAAGLSPRCITSNTADAIGVTKLNYKTRLPRDLDIWSDTVNFGTTGIDQVVLACQFSGAGFDAAARYTISDFAVIFPGSGGVENTGAGTGRVTLRIKKWNAAGTTSTNVCLIDDTSHTIPALTKDGRIEQVVVPEENSSGLSCTLTFNYAALPRINPYWSAGTLTWNYSGFAFTDSELSARGCAPAAAPDDSETVTSYTITLANSDKLAFGCHSYIAGTATIAGATYAEKIAARTLWNVVNYAIPGNALAEALRMMRANQTAYGAIGFNDIGITHMVVQDVANNATFGEMYYTQRDFKKVCTYLRARGINPILCGEHYEHSGIGQGYMATLSGVGSEMGVAVINMLPRLSQVMPASMDSLASGQHASSHLADRPGDAAADAIDERLFSIIPPEPRQGVRLFRLRSGIDGSVHDNLVHQTIVDFDLIWDGLRVGQRTIADAANGDSAGSSPAYAEILDEEQAIRSGTGVTFTDRCMIRCVTRATAEDTISMALRLNLTDATVSVLDRNTAPVESNLILRTFFVDDAPSSTITADWRASCSDGTLTGTWQRSDAYPYVVDPQGRKRVILNGGDRSTPRGAGTLTRTSAEGTGPASISYTSTQTGRDGLYYINIDKPPGHYRAISGASGFYYPTSLSNCMDGSVIYFLVEKAGTFTITDVALLHSYTKEKTVLAPKPALIGANAARGAEWLSSPNVVDWDLTVGSPTLETPTGAPTVYAVTGSAGWRVCDNANYKGVTVTIPGGALSVSTEVEVWIMAEVSVAIGSLVAGACYRRKIEAVFGWGTATHVVRQVKGKWWGDLPFRTWVPAGVSSFTLHVRSATSAPIRFAKASVRPVVG